MQLKTINLSSPNYDLRKPSFSLDIIKMLVVHYTGMSSCNQAIQRLCDPKEKVSAHLLIDEDGTIYRLVADEFRAWHAGLSFWQGNYDINSISIGIELANPGHEWGYRSFPTEQINSLIDIVNYLIDKYNIPNTGIVGHSDIAPGRKKDPGELFPWKKLSNAGIGIWPDDLSVNNNNGNFWDNLSTIGYAVSNYELSKLGFKNYEIGKTRVIEAFQRRFTPHKISGHIDNETIMMSNFVSRLYNQ